MLTVNRFLPLDRLCAAFIGGVLAMPWLSPTWSLWWLLLLTGASFAICMCMYRHALRTTTVLAVLLLSALLCGICWSLFNVKMLNLWQLPNSQWREPAQITIQVQQVSVQYPERWQFDGIIIDAPQAWKLPRFLSQIAPTRVRAQWYFPPDISAPQPGEIWQLHARARPATGLVNQGSRPIQVRWVRERIRASVQVHDGELLRVPHMLRISAIRHEIASQVQQWQRSVDNPRGLDYTGFLLALMTGNRQYIHTHQWQLFQQTGVAHIMAISGLHLTLVFGFAWWLARLGWLSCALGQGRQSSYERHALLTALLVAVAYAALADFAVSTTRALILVSFFVVTRCLGWQIAPLRILLRCVALLLLLDPFAWLDPGFWLSVTAVLAIFLWHWCAPWESRTKAGALQKIASLWRLEVLLTLALIPLTISYFQGIPWIAPLTNLWVIPIFTLLILPLCLLAALLIVLELLGVVGAAQIAYGLAYPADIALHSVIHGLMLSTYVPLHWQSVQDLRWSVIPLVWLVLRYWPGAMWQRLGASSVLSVTMLIWLQPPKPPEFAVHMLDVGQGNAIVIQRGRNALLYDAGPRFAGGFDTGRSVVIPFLRYHRLTPEWLVLSHPHQDHVGGAPSLTAAYPRMQVLETRLQGETSTDHSHSIPRRWPCEWGQVWRWQGVLIRALAPMPGPSFGPNNDSCVLLLEYNGQRVLLTGDIQRLTELRMVGRYEGSFQAHILQVPHHGSQTSSQTEFIDRVAPEVALVGAGFLNQWGMPHPDVRKRYAERRIPLFNTGDFGQISVILHRSKQNEYNWIIRPFRHEIQPFWYLQQVKP